MQTDGGFTGTVHSVRRFRACVCCPEKGVDSYMTERLRGQWKQRDMEWKVFVLFLSGMAVYYGYRLFALTPWYDELYTYYYFISRGPVYAAIHWPLPNNHVGYSVLSGILNLFGNPAIGLRGISWISSLISLCLLFAAGRKCLPKGAALLPVFLFAPMGLVNQLAVQGRGYALASCLYLTAVYELLHIVKDEDVRPGTYVITGCSFVWALYTLPSSVYFVLPLCLIGGTWLLLERRKKEFFSLLITAIIAAVCTIGLYALIWLAIGSNLLSKTPDSGCYGQGHISIILNAPFKALKTGIDYMLDTPYIQSVGREGYFERFGIWMKNLFASYYAEGSILLLALTGIGVVMLFIWLIRRMAKRKGEQGFLEWYLFLTFLLTPLMLVIQASLPYYRVFSFLGVPVALLLVWMFVQFASRLKKPLFLYVAEGLAGVMCAVFLLSPAGRAQYGGREAAIEDAYSHMALQNGETVCATDCDQEYLLKYLYNREDVRPAIEEADYVLLDRELFLSEEEMNLRDAAGADAWKYYVSHDSIPWDYVEEKMDICYENSRFILYRKK